MASLPPLAPFPKASWQQHLSPKDWDALVEAWVALSQAYLSLSDDEFARATADDESVSNFVSTFVSETASLSRASTSTALLKPVFQLMSRLLTLAQPPQLLEYQFLSGFAKVYPKKRAAPLLSQLFANHAGAVESSLAALKKLLIPQLDAGIKGDPHLVESNLGAINPLLHASPHACILFLAGSDFSDGLVTCFRVMNPPLRKVIITTMYLCLVGLTEAEPPKWAMLSDELFTLKTAADAHKQGPLNVNDSLVAELVTATPLLKILLRRAEVLDSATDSLKKRITALESFKKGAMVRPKRLTRRKVDKGKGSQTREDVHAEMHIHRMSQITQVQDLFPDLGAGFVSKCLDEYDDNVEQVVANLLAETLPSHLATANRGDPLYDFALETHIHDCNALLTYSTDHFTMRCRRVRTWHHVQLHPWCPPDAMSLTMMTLTTWPPMYPKYPLERSQQRPPMRSSRTNRPHPTKLPSYLHLQLLTLTTMNGMIHMTLPTSAVL